MLKTGYPRLLEFRSDTRKLRLHLVVSGAFLLLLTIVIALIGEDRVGEAIHGFTQKHSRIKLCMEIISHGLNYSFYALFLAIGIWGLIGKRDDLFRYALVYLLVQLAAAAFLSRILKVSIGRRRPGIEGRISRWDSSGQAFPSGHTTDMACSASVLSYFLKPVVLRVLLYACIALMAISRAGLGAHHPFDVVGGAFLGLFSGYVISHLFAGWLVPKSISTKKGDQKEQPPAAD